MSTLELIQLIGIGIAILVVAIYMIVMAIKNKWLQKLIETVKTAIAEAEYKFGAGHGEEKKAFVIDAIKAKCAELGIPYELLYKLINKLIDNIVDDYNVIKKYKK